jgi:hypothetical protein
VAQFGQIRGMGLTFPGRPGHSSVLHVFMTHRLTVVDMG